MVKFKVMSLMTEEKSLLLHREMGACITSVVSHCEVNKSTRPVLLPTKSCGTGDSVIWEKEACAS